MFTVSHRKIAAAAAHLSASTVFFAGLRPLTMTKMPRIRSAPAIAISTIYSAPRGYPAFQLRKWFTAMRRYAMPEVAISRRAEHRKSTGGSSFFMTIISHSEASRNNNSGIWGLKLCE